MSGQLYEIITKATISKGCKKTINKYTFEIPNAREVLGCYVMEHTYRGFVEGMQSRIEGQYALHLWCLDHQDTFLVKQNIQYNDYVELNTKGQLQQKDEVVVECRHLPQCLSASCMHGQVIVEIEKEMSIRIVGETTILVESPSDEEIEINQNFIA